MVELFSKGVAWNDFLGLERELLKALEYVPLRPAHYLVWSHQFGKTLDETGSAIGSFFDAAVQEGVLLRENELSRKIINGKLKRPDIRTYCSIVEPVYALSSAEVIASDGSVQYGPFLPFKEFGEMAKSKTANPPKWWSGYNQYKHNRYTEADTANLENALGALGGLFILNILHKENQEFLVRKGVIKIGGWNEDVIVENIRKTKFGYPCQRSRYLECDARSEMFTHYLRFEGSVSPASPA